MAKHIVIERPNGTVTIVRSEIETPSEDPLTEHEQIINELYSKVKNLGLFSVKHRLCTNCKHCLPNAYAKYHHDRYFCTVDKNNDKVTITSPEHYNCNRHDFNGA